MIAKNIIGGLFLLGGASFALTAGIAPIFDDEPADVVVMEKRPAIVLAKVAANNLTPLKVATVAKIAQPIVIDKYPVLRPRVTCVVRRHSSPNIKSEHPFCDEGKQANKPVKTQLACNHCGGKK